MATGITKRHSKGCPGRDGGRCRCNAGYEAWVFSKRDDKKIRKTFAREAEAKSWRSSALTATEKGALRPARPTTVNEAWEQWYEGAKAGTIRNRSGQKFKPSALRGYEKSMRLRVLKRFGDQRLADVSRIALQDFVEDLIGKGLSASTIQVTLLPLRALFKRALRRDEIAVNPCAELEMPAITGRRERFASSSEAEALIAAAPEEDRPVWATSFYAGLRRGELMALRWEDVDLAEGLIQVRWGWDDREGEIALKSRAGRRRVPIIPALREFLIAHKLRSAGSERVFGPEAGGAAKRATSGWQDAGLERLTLHEARHTYASLMIAAGVNAKALSTFMGHANISITLDRYGHLMPGSEAEAAELLASYLKAQRDRTEEEARKADTGASAGAQTADLAL